MSEAIGWHEILNNIYCGMCAEDLEEGDRAYWTGSLWLCGSCAVDEWIEYD
jgi:hypothetical protein